MTRNRSFGPPAAAPLRGTQEWPGGPLAAAHSPDLAEEQHYTPAQVAAILNVSVDTVIRWFRKTPGVIAVGNEETLYKRRKQTIRIPQSVLAQWHLQHRTVK